MKLVDGLSFRLDNLTQETETNNLSLLSSWEHMDQIWTNSSEPTWVHGTNLAPLRVCDHCVTWSVCKAHSSKIRTCPWHLVDTWESVPYAELPCSVFIQREELAPISAWCAMLWGLPLSECRQRRSCWMGNGEVDGSEGERTGGNEGGEPVSVCKIKEKMLIKIA